jgi:hypothetical protein
MKKYNEKVSKHNDLSDWPPWHRPMGIQKGNILPMSESAAGLIPDTLISDLSLLSSNKTI